jgi:ER membrane protein complex subunit 7
MRRSPTSLPSCWLVVVYAAITLGAVSYPTEASSSPAFGRLYGTVEYPDGTPFNATVKIALNHGERVTYSRQDGSFSLDRVPAGIHVLDIHDPVYHFSQFKVQLLAEDIGNPKVLEYYYPGGVKQTRALPIVWVPLATYEYFEHRSGFSMFAMLKNPMILLMLFSAGMMVRSL